MASGTSGEGQRPPTQTVSPSGIPSKEAVGTPPFVGSLQQEAWLRGLTVADFRARLNESVEIIWDHLRLRRAQVVHALRSFSVREIGPGRFILALPVDLRPPYDDTGISPRDFEPLCSGIARKD